MIRTRTTIAITAGMILLLSGCGTAAPRAASTPTPTKSAGAAAHWGYQGNDGPTHWGDLSSDYATCSTGKHQSPVNLGSAEQQNLANIEFHYQPSKVNIVNNGHTIQVNYDAGSYITVDGVRYDLLQFHFHAPSEHSINGKLAAAELHLVHKSAAGKLAVVGVLIEQAATENGAIASFWKSLPATEGPQKTLDAEVDSTKLLPAAQTTYRYDGSLTTPPCTEGVKWMVMTQPISFSAAQLAEYTTLFEGNNRPIQNLDGRTEVEDTTP